MKQIIYLLLPLIIANSVVLSLEFNPLTQAELLKWNVTFNVTLSETELMKVNYFARERMNNCADHQDEKSYQECLRKEQMKAHAKYIIAIRATRENSINEGCRLVTAQDIKQYNSMTKDEAQRLAPDDWIEINWLTKQLVNNFKNSKSKLSYLEYLEQGIIQV